MKQNKKPANNHTILYYFNFTMMCVFIVVLVWYARFIEEKNALALTMVFDWIKSIFLYHVKN